MLLKSCAGEALISFLIGRADIIYHGILEWFGLEGTLKDYVFPILLLWTEVPSMTSDCSKHHPTWP